MAAPVTRVLHVLHNLNAGGMEGRVARLARGLDPARFHIHVLTLRQPDVRQVELPPHVDHSLVEVPPGLHPGRLIALARFIRRERPDIVHTHNWGTMFYGVLAARLAGVKVVIHGEHGLDANSNSDSSKRILAQRALARLLARVVTVNAAIARVVKREWKIDDARIRILPNGVDLGRFRPAASPPEVFTVGTVTRYDTVKNLPCLIEGFRLFKSRIGSAPAKLVLVGGGPRFQEIEALCRQGQEAGNICLAAGTASPEQWYGAFSVYANTSSYEGMSNTILEAMASGLPVVASDVVGNRDWLEEGRDALFFRSGDPQDLAEKLERLYREPGLREEIGARNLRRAGAEFDNREFIWKYERIYAECLKSRE